MVDDGLTVAADVADFGFVEHIGHVGAKVGYRDAIAEQAFEFIGEFEPGI